MDYFLVTQSGNRHAAALVSKLERSLTAAQKHNISPLPSFVAFNKALTNKRFPELRDTYTSENLHMVALALARRFKLDVSFLAKQWGWRRAPSTKELNRVARKYLRRK